MIKRSPHQLIASALLGVGLLLSTELQAAPKKLLVVTTTSGFRHGPAIEAAQKVLPELANASGGDFTLEFLKDLGPKPSPGRPPERGPKMTDAQWEEAEAKFRDALAMAKTEGPKWTAEVNELFAQKLDPKALSGFDGVIFCNTTGDLPLPDGEGFRAWVQSGKAFIGMHAATDTLKAMPAYTEMINGSFAGHPWGGGGTYTFANHEPAHPAVAMFPNEFQWSDEIYQYTNFNPEAVRVLISLDIGKSQPSAPYHVPVSWVRQVGSGRLFYTNFGHNASSWTNESYQKHIVAGIRWALKLSEGPSEPNPAVSAQQAIKSFAATAATALSLDATALEKKGIAKAAKDPQWAMKFRAEADAYRALPAPNAKKDATPAEVEKAKLNQSEMLKKLLSQIEG